MQRSLIIIGFLALAAQPSTCARIDEDPGAGTIQAIKVLGDQFGALQKEQREQKEAMEALQEDVVNAKKAADAAKELGQASAGNASAGEASAGNASAGEASAGNASAGEASVGNASAEETSAGDSYSAVDRAVEEAKTAATMPTVSSYTGAEEGPTKEEEALAAIRADPPVIEAEDVLEEPIQATEQLPTLSVPPTDTGITGIQDVPLRSSWSTCIAAEAAQEAAQQEAEDLKTKMTADKDTPSGAVDFLNQAEVMDHARKEFHKITGHVLSAHEQATDLGTPQQAVASTGGMESAADGIEQAITAAVAGE